MLAQENAIQIYDLGGDELSSFFLSSRRKKIEKSLPERIFVWYNELIICEGGENQ